MHQGRVLTDPMGNGPGRMLGLASAYVTISEDKTFEKNPELLPVHKEAKATLENNFVMGPLEQYILYHNAISYLDDYLRDLFRDSIVIFVPYIPSWASPSACNPSSYNRIESFTELSVLFM